MTSTVDVNNDDPGAVCDILSRAQSLKKLKFQCDSEQLIMGLAHGLVNNSTLESLEIHGEACIDDRSWIVALFSALQGNKSSSLSSLVVRKHCNYNTEMLERIGDCLPSLTKLQKLILWTFHDCRPPTSGLVAITEGMRNNYSLVEFKFTSGPSLLSPVPYEVELKIQFYTRRNQLLRWNNDKRITPQPAVQVVTTTTSTTRANDGFAPLSFVPNLMSVRTMNSERERLLLKYCVLSQRITNSENERLSLTYCILTSCCHLVVLCID